VNHHGRRRDLLQSVTETSWTASLTRTLRPRNHAALRTLADVRAYMLDLPEDMVGRQAWQQAAKLLLAAAENPKTAAINAATKQLELALFLTGRHGMSKI
jgi:hypothetical protein